MTNIQWLPNWYVKQCDGEWEHAHGVSIGTLDNPGWTVRVSLTGTPFEHLTHADFEKDYEDESLWLRCWIGEKAFNAACGPTKLDEVIGIFRNG